HTHPLAHTHTPQHTYTQTTPHTHTHTHKPLYLRSSLCHPFLHHCQSASHHHRLFIFSQMSLLLTHTHTHTREKPLSHVSEVALTARNNAHRESTHLFTTAFKWQYYLAASVALFARIAISVVSHDFSQPFCWISLGGCLKKARVQSFRPD